MQAASAPTELRSSDAGEVVRHDAPGDVIGPHGPSQAKHRLQGAA